MYPNNSKIYRIAADIVDLSSHFDAVSFQCISKDKNTAADLLTKHSIVLGEALMAGT